MIISLLFACSDSAFIKPEPTQTWEEDQIDSTRLLLRRQDELLDKIEHRGRALSITRDIDALNIQEVEVPENVDLYDIIAELSQTGEYEFVEPVILRSIPEGERMELAITQDPVRSPNDPYFTFGYQENMNIIQAANLSGAARGAGAIVAVIDTGVGTGGEDTPINMLAGFDFVNNDNNADDDEGHGTHVAGTIAQATNNGTGAMGVVPNVSILPLKVLDADGVGFNTDTIDAINYAVQQGADVLNLSLGADVPSQAEEAAVNAAVNAGVVVVGASGNDGDKSGTKTYYPGSYANAIAVTATDMEGNVTSYSNTGSAIDLSAPGGDLSADFNNDNSDDGIVQETTDGNGNYAYYLYQGTSMATPHVAGAFASLMASGATASEAEEYLFSTAADYGPSGKDSNYGHGEIRIQDALDAYLAAGSNDLADLNVGDLVITELMPSPAQVDDWKGEWIELYNNTNSELNLNGLAFSSTGDLGFTVSSDVFVAAGGYALFAVNSFSTGNGGLSDVDYSYSYSNNLKLDDQDSLSIGYDGLVFDSISWNIADYDLTEGFSLAATSLSASENDSADGWCLGGSSYGAGGKGSPGLANTTCSVISSISAGDIIVSEIMVDPTQVENWKGQWFELYNTTNTSINLNGLRVGSAGQSGFLVSEDISIAAGGYAVFALRTDSTNGGITQVDYVYSYDDVKLYSSDSLTLSMGSTTLDTVSYDADTFSVNAGASIGTVSYNASDNDSSIYWCNATSSYGAGDLGTPGSANDTCSISFVDLSNVTAGDLIISEIMADPVQVDDWKGEWFELYNNTSDTINLNGLQVSSAGHAGFTVSSDVLVPAGDYAVFAIRADSANGGITQVDYTYAYNDFKLYNSDSITISIGQTMIDTVEYTAVPFGVIAGASIGISNLDATTNDISAYWCNATSSYGDGDLGTPGSANATCSVSVSDVSNAAAGDLIVSEIMSDPAQVADWRGEWFEIYNNTSDAMNLNGLQVGSAGQAGFTVSSDLIIAAADYAVFAIRADAANGGITQVDHIYAYNDLKLYNSDSITLSVGQTTIDSVSYNSAFGVSAGASISLSSLDASDNDSALHWCAATSSYGSGDLGTPGADNDECSNTTTPLSSLGAGDLIISEIMIDPTQTADWRGEWFEIYNNSGLNVNLNGLQVSSGGDNGFAVSTDIVIEAGGYLLFANRIDTSINGNLQGVDIVYSYNDVKFLGVDSLTIGSANISTIDTVSFDNSWAQEAGKSLSLSVLNATSNNASSNWCAASSTYGNGDFGTPGNANDSCP